MGSNSKWLMHHQCGVQGVLMNFGGGFHGDKLKGYRLKFLNKQKAFILKPLDLRRRPETILKIDPQNPEFDPVQKERNFNLGAMDVNLGIM